MQPQKKVEDNSNQQKDEKKEVKDEVTQQKQQKGEQKVSKNEQKRRLKEQKKAKERLEKQAKKVAEKLAKEKQKIEKGQNTKKEQEVILDPTAYFENRSNMVMQLKKSPQTYPYPHKFHVKYNLKEYIQAFSGKCAKGQFLEDTTSIAGRITNIRAQGKNLVFYDIIGEGCKLQVMCNSAAHKGKNSFQQTHSVFRRGDIIGVIGNPGRTKRQELSIAPGQVHLLSPCLHMLPEAHVGLKNQQTRFRKRYLDLIMNNKTRDTFIVRSKVLKFIREYLTKLNFIEVQTPMMNMIPGGATARPFTTYHNDLSMKLYMRIAPELFLKECIVGGLDRVFQIGKNFRNQSIDQTHNPEYTSCEFYMAYADYNDLMDLTQDMLSSMVKQLTGSYIIKFHPEPENPDKILDIDFTPPWKRMSMMQELEKAIGSELPKDITTQEARVVFDKLCIKNNITCNNPRTTSRLIDKLVGHFLQSQCLCPTFIMQHPQLMSPLAKYHRQKPGLTERFQLFINYHEFCNAYTELNDPFVQKQLFLQQVKEKEEKGDEESMFYDQTFVNALEHALPPTAGWGLGVDRTVMLITDHIKIQEVLLFPAMKPIQEKKQKLQKQ